MFCRRCGMRINEHDVFCGACGAPIGPSSPPPAPPSPSARLDPTIPSTSSNTLSTIGIALGAISFFVLPLFLGAAGIVLGVVGRSRGETRAKTAIWVSAVGLVAGMILGAVMWGSM